MYNSLLDGNKDKKISKTKKNKLLENSNIHAKRSFTNFEL